MSMPEGFDSDVDMLLESPADRSSDVSKLGCLYLRLTEGREGFELESGSKQTAGELSAPLLVEVPVWWVGVPPPAACLFATFWTPGVSNAALLPER